MVKGLLAMKVFTEMTLMHYSMVILKKILIIYFKAANLIYLDIDGFFKLSSTSN